MSEMKILGNSAVFAVVYILFMIPTYLLPYLGSNSAVLGVYAASNDRVHVLFWLHLCALLVLIAITWFRGSYVDKKWLVIFPALGAVFDLAPALNIIHLVPTVMHLLAIVLGVIGSDRQGAGSG